MRPVSVSVVVLVNSRNKYVAQLSRELEITRFRWVEEHAPMQLSEVIFVHNPTTDESPDIVDQLAEEKIWHKVIHLSRNFGQHPATIAGILHSSGDWVFTIG